MAFRFWRRIRLDLLSQCSDGLSVGRRLLVERPTSLVSVLGPVD